MIVAVTLEGLLRPGQVAFVMSEVQDGIIGELAPWPALAIAANKVGLVDNAARIAEAARARGAPVIHCTAEGLPGRFGANTNARLYGNARKRSGESGRDPRFDRPSAEVWRDGDILLPRFHGTSAMTGSPLDSLLRNHGVTTLIVAGVSVCFGVLNLTFDAANRAYQVILPRDAVAGFPEDYAQAVMANTLSMLATIASTDEILAAWPVGAEAVTG
jgi:nicotinamidase-related amidase